MEGGGADDTRRVYHIVGRVFFIYLIVPSLIELFFHSAFFHWRRVFAGFSVDFFSFFFNHFVELEQLILTAGHGSGIRGVLQNGGKETHAGLIIDSACGRLATIERS